MKRLILEDVVLGLAEEGSSEVVNSGALELRSSIEEAT